MKKYITVYCGSNKGVKPLYQAKAIELARAMVDKGYHLKYGAGNIGLMSVIADEVLAQGGEVIGIIPQHLMDREVGHLGLTELVITGSMHERKQELAHNTEAFIAMPGGIGTLEEIIEVMVWSQLDLHTKPVCLYNVDGFYDHLLHFLKDTVAKGFLKQPQIDRLIVTDDVADLFDKIANYDHNYIPKWID